MFRIFVVLMLKSQFISWALPTQYPGKWECEAHATNLELHWRVKKGATLIGFECVRSIEA